MLVLTCLLTTWLFAIAQTPSAPAKEIEPNDERAQAQLVSPNTSVAAAFTFERRNDDPDYYVIDASRPGMHTFRITPAEDACRYWVATDVTSAVGTKGLTTLTIENVDGVRVRTNAQYGSDQRPVQGETQGQAIRQISLWVSVAPNNSGGGEVQCVAGGPRLKAVPYTLTYSFAPSAAAPPSAPTAPAPARPEVSQPAAPTDLENQAYQLGMDAGRRAQADPANAETIIADQYRLAMALGPDESSRAQAREAFRRGYLGSAQTSPVTQDTSPPPDEAAWDSLASISSAPPAAYIHPRVGFQLETPEGWQVDDNAPTADVQMRSAQGDGLIEVVSGPVSVRLDSVSYAAGWESVSVGPGRRLTAKAGGRQITVDDQPAYDGFYEGDGVLVRVVFVGTDQRFFVLTAVFPRERYPDGAAVFERVLQSLRLPRGGGSQ